jgi:hypothetical protein
MQEMHPQTTAPMAAAAPPLTFTVPPLLDDFVFELSDDEYFAFRFLP